MPDRGENFLRTDELGIRLGLTDRSKERRQAQYAYRGLRCAADAGLRTSECRLRIGAHREAAAAQRLGKFGHAGVPRRVRLRERHTSRVMHRMYRDFFAMKNSNSTTIGRHATYMLLVLISHSASWAARKLLEQSYRTLGMNQRRDESDGRSRVCKTCIIG